METKKHWRGEEIDPEKSHGKEEWEWITPTDLEDRYKRAIGEIEYILGDADAFNIPEGFISELNKNGEINQIPSFIISHPDFETFYTNPEKIQKHGEKFQQATKQELRVSKENVSDDIKEIHNACLKVYKAVKEVLLDFIRCDYLRAKNSQVPGKLGKLDSVKDDAVKLIEFFGVRAQHDKPSGLVYGSDIENLLWLLEQTGHGAVVTTIGGRSIPQNNDFQSDRTNVSLELLEELQRAAVLKAKDFIAVQKVLNPGSVLRDPAEVANEFVNRLKYNPPNGGISESEISNVMRVTMNYINENHINNLYGRVNTVRKKCGAMGLAGSKNSQANYIKYYAIANGKYQKPENNINQSEK